MKALLANLFFILCFCSYGQVPEVKKMMKSIEGKWSLDDNRNVTYQRVVEVPEMKKDDIYDRVLNYFVYNYGSGKSMIQVQDKEKGQIIGKGIYKDVHSFGGFGWTYISTWHILRVDVKDGKARIILTLTQYIEDFKGGSLPPSSNTYNIREEFPVNQEGGRRNIMGKSFYYSHIKAISSLNAIEKAIKIGNTSKQIENDKW